MPKAKQKSKAVKRSPGRPKAEIDWNYVGKMLEAGSTAIGIAATIGVDEDTLRKRCPTDNNCTFSEFSQQKKAKGDELLRAKQYQTAMAGNVTMQIWLGKQRLAQSDKVKNEHSGPDGGPIQTTQIIIQGVPGSDGPVSDS